MYWGPVRAYNKQQFADVIGYYLVRGCDVDEGSCGASPVRSPPITVARWQSGLNTSHSRGVQPNKPVIFQAKPMANSHSEDVRQKDGYRKTTQFDLRVMTALASVRHRKTIRANLWDS